MNIAVTLRILAIASFAFSLCAHAECPFPKAPATVPDGRTATEAQMLTAMNAFKTYNDAVTAFGECLDQETREKAVGTAQLLRLKTMQSKKHNAAVDELKQKASLFNEQVRIFKARG